LPSGWAAEALLRLLVGMIQTPKASPAVLAHALQRQGLHYTPVQVRQVLTFYELKKKRHPRPRPVD
jgi:hypothetical protein